MELAILVLTIVAVIVAVPPSLESIDNLREKYGTRHKAKNDAKASVEIGKFKKFLHTVFPYCILAFLACGITVLILANKEIAVLRSESSVPVPAPNTKYDFQYKDNMDNVGALSQLALDAFNTKDYPACAIAYQRLMEIENNLEAEHQPANEAWWVNKPKYELAKLSLNPTSVGYDEFFAHMNEILDTVELQIKNKDAAGTFYSRTRLAELRSNMRIAQSMICDAEAQSANFSNLFNRLDKIQNTPAIPQ